MSSKLSQIKKDGFFTGCEAKTTKMILDYFKNILFYSLINQ